MSELTHERLRAAHADTKSGNGVFDVVETESQIVARHVGSGSQDPCASIPEAIEKALTLADKWDEDWENRNWTELTAVQRAVLRSFEGGDAREHIKTAADVGTFGDGFLKLLMDTVGNREGDAETATRDLRAAYAKVQEVYRELHASYDPKAKAVGDLNKPQTFLVRKYASGQFADVVEREKDADSLNDPLFRYLMSNLSKRSGCDSALEANSRLENVIDLLAEADDAIIEFATDTVAPEPDDRFAQAEAVTQATHVMQEHMANMIRREASPERKRELLPDLETAMDMGQRDSRTNPQP